MSLVFATAKSLSGGFSTDVFVISISTSCIAYHSCARKYISINEREGQPNGGGDGENRQVVVALLSKNDDDVRHGDQSCIHGPPALDLWVDCGERSRRSGTVV